MKKSLSKVLFLSLLVSCVTASISKAGLFDWFKPSWEIAAGACFSAAAGFNYLWTQSSKTEARARQQEVVLHTALQKMRKITSKKKFAEQIDTQEVSKVLKQLDYAHIEEFEEIAREYNQSPLNKEALRESIESHIFAACGQTKPIYRVYTPRQARHVQFSLFQKAEKKEVVGCSLLAHKDKEGVPQPPAVPATIMKTKAGIPTHELKKHTFDVLSHKASQTTNLYFLATGVSIAAVVFCLNKAMSSPA